MTVVIPAYNAEATINETMESVRAQSHSALEILVVDDGSTDSTVSLVEVHARIDPRIRLIRQRNAGVAAARNRGIEEASGEFVAPVDSDDLWHPEKIARQVAVMQRSRGQVALVCTLYALIDERGRVIAERAGAMPPSWQFEDLCARNFIGNGSSALMRRSAVLAAGGYDTTLRARKAQGCEDLKLYLQLAELYRMEMVPLPLTGYRQLPYTMSSDGRQMLRSFDIVSREFCRRRPALATAFGRHRLFMTRWLIGRAISGRQWRLALSLTGELCSRPPLSVAATLMALPRPVAKVLVKRALPRSILMRRARHYLDTAQEQRVRRRDRIAAAFL